MTPPTGGRKNPVQSIFPLDICVLKLRSNDCLRINVTPSGFKPSIIHSVRQILTQTHSQGFIFHIFCPVPRWLRINFHDTTGKAYFAHPCRTHIRTLWTAFRTVPIAKDIQTHTCTRFLHTSLPFVLLLGTTQCVSNVHSTRRHGLLEKALFLRCIFLDGRLM